MLKVVFDTNIIVSGLIAHSGNPYKILEAWRQGDVVLLVSKPIVDEVVSVLQRPFFREKRQIGKADVVRIRRALETDTVMVSPQVHLKVVANDPADDRILECALEGGADYLVSGDHHLLELKRYRHVRIVTARQFLAILESQT